MECYKVINLLLFVVILLLLRSITEVRPDKTVESIDYNNGKYSQNANIYNRLSTTNLLDDPIHLLEKDNNNNPAKYRDLNIIIKNNNTQKVDFGGTDKSGGFRLGVTNNSSLINNNTKPDYIPLDTNKSLIFHNNINNNLLLNHNTNTVLFDGIENITNSSKYAFSEAVTKSRNAFNSKELGFDNDIGAVFRDVANSNKMINKYTTIGNTNPVTSNNLLDLTSISAPTVSETSNLLDLISIAAPTVGFSELIKSQQIFNLNNNDDEFEHVSKVKRNSSPKPIVPLDNNIIDSIPRSYSMIEDLQYKKSLTSANNYNYDLNTTKLNSETTRPTIDLKSTLSNVEINMTTSKPEQATSSLVSDNFYITDVPLIISALLTIKPNISNDITTYESITQIITVIPTQNSSTLNTRANFYIGNGDSSNLSWLGLFFSQYRNAFWMTFNSFFLISSIICGLFCLYRLVWLQWCSPLMPRTFYLVIHLLAFTGAAFLSVQLLHLLFGSDEGLPLVLTLMLVHTPESCLIVTLWFVIHCILISSRLNLFGDYIPTSNHLAVSSGLIIIGSFSCDIIIGTSHSIWFLLLSRITISLMAAFPGICYLLKYSKVKQVSSMLQRELQGELKLLVAPVNNSNVPDQNDIRYLLRERLTKWSMVVFYCTIIGFVLMICNCILSVFFTVSHVPIALWWFFHIFTCLSYFALILSIVIASACTLQNEDKTKTMLQLLQPPKTIHKPPSNPVVNNESFIYDSEQYSNAVELQHAPSALQQHSNENRSLVRNNSVRRFPTPPIRPRTGVRRSATFNCDPHNRMYHIQNHAMPSYQLRAPAVIHSVPGAESHPRGNTMLVQDRGFIRFRMPMEVNHPNVEHGLNVPNDLIDVNIYQTRSETGYGSLKSLPLKSSVLHYNEGYQIRSGNYSDVTPRNNYGRLGNRPQYKLNCRQRYLYSPMNVVRPSLYRNSSFTVPQSALHMGPTAVEPCTPYLIKSRAYDSPSTSSVAEISQQQDRPVQNNPILSTFKPNHVPTTPPGGSDPLRGGIALIVENKAANLQEQELNHENVLNKSTNSSNDGNNVPSSPTKSSPNKSITSLSNNHDISISTTSNDLSPVHNPSITKTSPISNSNLYSPKYISNKPIQPNNLDNNIVNDVNSSNFDSCHKPNLLGLVDKMNSGQSESKTTKQIVEEMVCAKPEFRISKKLHNIESIPIQADPNNSPDFNKPTQADSSILPHENNCTDETADISLNNTSNNDDDDNSVEIELSSSRTSLSSYKGSSLKRNNSTAGCYASPRRENSFHEVTDKDNSEFPKPDSKSDKYPWYGTWGGRRKSRKGIPNMNDQFQSSVASVDKIQNQPRHLSSSRASLVSIYGKLRQKSKKFSSGRHNKSGKSNDSNEASCSSTQDENYSHNSDSDDTISNSREQSLDEEDSDSTVDNKSIDWALELIKSSEMLSGFYAIEIPENSPEPNPIRPIVKPVVEAIQCNDNKSS